MQGKPLLNLVLHVIVSKLLISGVLYTAVCSQVQYFLCSTVQYN